MRLLPAILLLAAAVSAAEQPSAPPYPLWDGQEITEQYARRAKLPSTQTLDLGNGVKLELALIPAGKFTIGTAEPVPVDEEGFRKRIIIGQAVLAAGGGALLVFLAVIAMRAIRQRRRPQYSLACFVAMIVVAGVGVLGGTHWRESARVFSDAKAEYRAALARYREADRLEKPAHEVTLTKPFYMPAWEPTRK